MKSLENILIKWRTDCNVYSNELTKINNTLFNSLKENYKITENKKIHEFTDVENNDKYNNLLIRIDPHIQAYDIIKRTMIRVITVSEKFTNKEDVYLSISSIDINDKIWIPNEPLILENTTEINVKLCVFRSVRYIYTAKVYEWIDNILGTDFKYCKTEHELFYIDLNLLPISKC